MLAFVIDIIGNEDYDIRFKDIQNDKILEIKPPHKTNGAYVWSPIENSIFYTVDSNNRANQLWYLNIDTKKNILIFEEKNIGHSIDITISNDKKYLFVESLSINTTQIYYYRFIKKGINR